MTPMKSLKRFWRVLGLHIVWLPIMQMRLRLTEHHPMYMVLALNGEIIHSQHRHKIIWIGWQAWILLLPLTRQNGADVWYLKPVKMKELMRAIIFILVPLPRLFFKAKER